MPENEHHISTAFKALAEREINAKLLRIKRAAKLSAEAIANSMFAEVSNAGK